MVLKKNRPDGNRNGQCMSIIKTTLLRNYYYLTQTWQKYENNQ